MGNMASYQEGYTDGFDDGRYNERNYILNKLVEIVKQNNFPEYVESDLIDYLKENGKEI